MTTYAVADTVALTGRTLRHVTRSIDTVITTAVTPIAIMLMFVYVFGGAIDPGGAIKYVDFLVPGFLVTTILWAGMSAGAGVAEDSSSGVYDRLRSLPIPRSAVMAGRSLADLTLVGWGIFVTAIVGFAVGFHTHSSVGQVLFAFLLMLIAGYAFTWVFITVGLVSGNAQAAQGLSMLVIPFSFVSSANVPVSTMPGWMQPFAANQPISVFINAVRSLMQGGTQQVGIGHTTTYWVVLTLAWSVGITLVFGAITVRKFGRQI